MNPDRWQLPEFRDHSGLRKRAASDSSSSSTTVNKRTPPKCGRCKNHSLDIPLKNHKRYCMWKDCTCSPCLLVVARRLVTKEQTALRRAIKQEEKKIIDIAEVKPLALPDPVSVIDLNRVCNKTQKPNGGGITDSINMLSSPQKRSSEAQCRKNAETLLGYSMKLLQFFPYSWHESQHISLMYVILKMARADLDQAKRLIMEANNEIRRLPFWDDFKERRTHTAYDVNRHNGYVTLRNTVDSPPTYLDQPPYIGTIPPIPMAHQRPFVFPPNPHILTTEGSSGLDSPPECSIDSGRTTAELACGPLDMGKSSKYTRD